MTSTRQIFLLAGTIVFLVVTTLYWSGLQGGFFFDDEVNILNAEGLRMEDLSLQSIRDAFAEGSAGPSGRPVAQLSFAINHLFSGLDPFAFKLTNLVLHLAIGILVYLIAWHLLAKPMLAGIAATYWLVSPIQLTPVLYVVQRMTSLSALFVLTGFLLHMVGRKCGGRSGAASVAIAWGLCWPLAIFSKETGILFPLFVLAWELIVRRHQIGRLDVFARVFIVVVGVGFAMGFIYSVLPAGQWIWAGYDLRSFSLYERLLTEARVLWFYLGLITFPRLEKYALHHDDLALSTGLLDPWTTLPACFGVVGLIWLVWRAREVAPLLSFGLAWFLIGHSLESTVLPLEIAHEHRNYLPLFGLTLIGTWATGYAFTRPGWPKTLGMALVISFLGYSTLITSMRAHLYGDELRRTQIESQYHPDSARTHYEAGRELVSRIEIISANSSSYFFARKHYERAGEIDPNLKMPWLGLIHLNCIAGTPAEEVWIDELAYRMNGLPLGPGDRSILFSVKEMSLAGTLCLSRSEVERLFFSAITNPTVSPYVSAMLYSWLADYLILVGRDLPAAQQALDKSLAILPHNASNQQKRAQLAYLHGRYDEARELLNRIEDTKLMKSERETKMLLLGCIGSGGGVKCVAQ